MRHMQRGGTPRCMWRMHVEERKSAVICAVTRRRWTVFIYFLHLCATILVNHELWETKTEYKSQLHKPSNCDCILDRAIVVNDVEVDVQRRPQYVASREKCISMKRMTFRIATDDAVFLESILECSTYFTHAMHYAHILDNNWRGLRIVRQ
jgi:hypothetical protein